MASELNASNLASLGELKPLIVYCLLSVFLVVPCFVSSLSPWSQDGDQTPQIWFCQIVSTNGTYFFSALTMVFVTEPEIVFIMNNETKHKLV